MTLTVCRLTPVLLALLSITGLCAGGAASTGALAGDGQDGSAYSAIETTPALDLGAFSTLEQIIPALGGTRVVLIGEQHTRYDHHLVQLEIIRRLHEQQPNLAIGMEMFQQPSQPYLDKYLSGAIDERSMLRDTEYFQRWRMDYRLYAPILRYAREQGLPVIALNVPTELTRRVGRVGLDGLNDAERRQLPDNIAPADEVYRQRMKAVYDAHPKEPGQRFEDFVEAQLLWDEGMAERAADYLEDEPGHRLVVIAGNQHVAGSNTLAARLQRRLDVSAARIVIGWEGQLQPGLADFLLMPEARTLPPAGKIGALLDENAGQVTIAECLENGACADAGMKHGDRITSIDNAGIDSTADLRLALWDKNPGDTISVEILRKRFLLPGRKLRYDITLK